MLRYMRVDLVIIFLLIFKQYFFLSLYMLTSVEQCSYRMGGRVCRLVRSGSNPNLLLMCVEFLNACIFSVRVCVLSQWKGILPQPVQHVFVVFVFRACGCRPAIASQWTAIAARGSQCLCSHSLCAHGCVYFFSSLPSICEKGFDTRWQIGT